MADLTSIGDFISNLSSQGAAWYRGITGTPVVVPATSPAIAAQQQVAIQQAAQASLSQTNPTLAGLLANPTLIVIVGLLTLGLILAIVLRK
jgi:hypothetical protein